MSTFILYFSFPYLSSITEQDKRLTWIKKKTPLMNSLLQCTYVLVLTHLVQVCSSSHNNDLGVAWITEICGQLPLSWAVPADVEEDLYHNKYYDDSAKTNKTCRQSFIQSKSSQVITELLWYLKILFTLSCMIYPYIIILIGFF